MGSEGIRVKHQKSRAASVQDPMMEMDLCSKAITESGSSDPRFTNPLRTTNVYAMEGTEHLYLYMHTHHVLRCLGKGRVGADVRFYFGCGELWHRGITCLDPIVRSLRVPLHWSLLG